MTPYTEERQGRTMTQNSPKILVITSNTGVERDELLVPLTRLRAAGAIVVHAAQKHAAVQLFLNDTDKDIVVQPDTSLAATDPAEFDALVIPGGTVNADTLRISTDAIALAKAFATAGKPIAAVCHAPWLLVETGSLKQRTLTSYQTIRTDLINAGAQWIDQSVVRDATGEWTLITARSPGDLDNFASAIATELGL